MTLVKIGGKILENQNDLFFTINQLKTLVFKKKILNKVIIITGGGSYANFIRLIDKKLNIGDDLAHWGAILAMEWNSIKLHNQFPEIPLFLQLSELSDYLKKNSKERQMLIFQSFSFLYKEDILPHSWKVTSDSIAIHIASKLGLGKCFLIKDIDGILDNNNKVIKELTIKQYHDFKKAKKIAKIPSKFKNLKKETPIDSYSLKLLKKNKMQFIILNGSRPNSRIIQYFTLHSNRDKIYTKISY
jgi:hypothetical protein